MTAAHASDETSHAPRRARDWARYHRVAPDIDLLEATFERHVYERHIHDTYAIGVTLRGIQRFWCSGTTHDCRPGDVIVIPPGAAHDGRSGSDGGYAYHMFYVSEGVLADVAADALERGPGVLHHGRECRVYAPELARRLDAAWRAMDADPGSLAAEESFRDAFAHVFARTGVRRSAPRSDRGRADPIVERVRDHLRESLGRPVSMGELAALASMSRFRLARRFAKAYGLPLHAYHVQLRLDDAKRRIRAGESLATVAAALGFADQSHLHRRFKGAFGVTPGAWRRTRIQDAPHRSA